ncbi:MAG: glycerol-3-phosphate 1-O-acyltransferase PlsY [Planctomycetaceae bacterium]|nr:glycerol-3-phosphate 1-O-acyltransferase PlsY [Planctomycetaceae bacterium]
MSIVLAVLAAYGIGAIPFGWLIARLVKGVDIRTVGSGNIGATNVARSIGKFWGLLVFVLDALKGMLPTAWLPWAVFPAADPQFTHLRVFCGLATIVGHMFPCWLRFRGGKGVATALGVVIVIAPLASAVAAGVFVVTFGLSRIVSLSSLLAAVTYGAVALWQLLPAPFSAETWSQAAFSLAVPLLIILRHRGNIRRLLRGEEPRFGTRPSSNKP